MTEKLRYTYSVLRYVHDVMTGEFLNVGVLVHEPTTGFVNAKFRTTIGRIREAFPDLDRAAYGSAIRRFRYALKKVAIDRSGSLPFMKVDAGALARNVLPSDDSSFQWSPVGSGIGDPNSALARLYERLVARYDTKQRVRKTDEDIWRPVRKQLEELHLDTRLEEKVIQGQEDEIVFKHAWKNGLWHCYEPLSLDLSEADSIKDKARRWRGHLASASSGAEPFRTYFLVGAPQDALLRNAYEKALKILQASDTAVEIFEENQLDDLVAAIEDEIAAHDDEQVPSPPAP